MPNDDDDDAEMFLCRLFGSLMSVTCRRICRLKRCTSVRSGFTASELVAAK